MKTTQSQCIIRNFNINGFDYNSRQINLKNINFYDIEKIIGVNSSFTFVTEWKNTSSRLFGLRRDSINKTNLIAGTSDWSGLSFPPIFDRYDQMTHFDRNLPFYQGKKLQ